MTLGRPDQGIFDIKIEVLQDGSEFAGVGWEVKAIKARHNTLTLSYRFTSSGKSVIISGDTGYFEGLIRFARCADLLVLECTMGKSIELPEEQIKEDDLYKSYKRSRDPKVWQALHEGYGHHTPEEAGLTASQAGVKKLVLTHISPFRDLEDMKRQAKKNFSGEVIIGEDLMTIEI
jgi:ribonuclease BN (tRNA processing enzyme)